MGRKSNRNRKGNVGQTNDVGVRVVLAYRFSAPATEADLTREMKREASSALREDSLQMIRDGDDVVVGNNEGFTLTREMRRRDEELREAQEQRRRIDEQLQELKEQRERPHWFAKMVRQRFLLTYKRDKLHTASDEDCDLIRKVNKRVHGGDALADAELYGDWGRRDYDVYKKLYGVHPKELGKFCIGSALHVMDEHATHVAADDRECSPKFEELFQKFLHKLKAAKYPDNFVDFLYDESCKDPAVAQVRHSYYEFFNSVATEVRYHGGKSNQ
ncbi:hypothetical protein BDV33DRAFT_208204 [Aspergillus novoparasiticus]|uniref:Uncharacterized protein n=1 Tax=Aspergillus novoparasiticus TaxID=986946 RepID=A0A5N6EE64_9EURO|nr:hypothetical protein BDV33DRAFT_208204 [Aspergillus novoparasiticus]